MGRPLTQGLFLEINYDTKYAVYTLDEEDKTYKDVVYPSLRKLYLQCEDPTEYTFAKKHLLGWDHWQRLCANKVLNDHFTKWRDELEISIRSAAIQSIMEESAGDKGFQAAKWLADRGWEKRTPGRPSKTEVQHRMAQDERLRSDFEEDFERLDTNGTVADRSLQ